MASEIRKARDAARKRDRYARMPEAEKEQRRAAQRAAYALETPAQRERRRDNNRRWRQRAAQDPAFAEKEAARRRLNDRLSKGAVDATGEKRVGACEICQREGALQFDHSHASGKFRGWLCKHCNTGLGHFRDDVGLLHAAAEYLKRA